MDRPASIVAATLIGIVAVSVFIIQPGYVQGLVDLGGLTGAQAGFVAAAEMAGYAATMILLVFVTHRLRWRPMLFLFIALQAAGNAASLTHPDLRWLCAARFLAGLGEGGLSSLSFTAIGLTRNPDRQFGFLIMWILVYGAIGLFGLPSLLGAIGLDGFYAVILVMTLMAATLVRGMLVRGGGDDRPADDVVTISVAGRAMAVLAIFGYFLGCGILWAYVSLIGDGRHLTPQAVSNALGASQFTGVAGAAVAGLLGARFGRVGPLTAAILLTAVSAAAIDGVDAHRVALFGGAVCLFNFAWNLAQPIFLSAATGFDRKGRLVTQMVASQSCGLAAGPFVGALIGGNDPGRALIWSATALFVAACVLIAVPLAEWSAARRREVASATLPAPAGT